jgi:hypothetical protein
MMSLMPFLAQSLTSELLIAREALVISGVALPTPELNNYSKKYALT